MLYRNHTDFEKLRNEIVDRLNQEGIRVKKTKQIPVSGEYSGVISCDKKALNFKF